MTLVMQDCPVDNMTFVVQSAVPNLVSLVHSELLLATSHRKPGVDLAVRAASTMLNGEIHRSVHTKLSSLFAATDKTLCQVMKDQVALLIPVGSASKSATLVATVGPASAG